MRRTKTIDKLPFLAPDVTTRLVPAPTDGWDAISPLSQMDPKRAPIIQNWVPRPGWVELRGGYIPYSSTGAAVPVETLLVWRGPGGEKMFAAAGAFIYNVSLAGQQTVVQSGLNSDRWQYTNFTPSGGNAIIQLGNGVDALRQYDGITNTWTSPVIAGLPGAFTSASIIHVHASKRRLWYTLKDSTIAAYMPTDAIAGAVAGTQDMGALWSRGGYLVGVTSWTIDGGVGPQEYVVFMSSRGEFTIYQGTDPTNAAAWALVGTFRIAPPVSRRCFWRMGSDVAILTLEGIIPISKALPFDPSADRSVSLTARIQNAMAQATQQEQNAFGWQMITFPAQQLFILNVPLQEDVSQTQFVMNMLTGAWCQFTGWNANCFEVYNENLYWGGNAGQINQGYIGGSDYQSSIAADLQCAFNWFDEPGRTKRMTLVQPLLTMGGSLTPFMAVDTDFISSSATAPITAFTGGSTWDHATWDVDQWAATSVNYTGWLSVNAMGHAMAIRMRVNLNTTPTNIGVFDISVFDTGVFDASFSVVIPTLQVNAFNTVLESGGAV